MKELNKVINKKINNIIKYDNLKKLAESRNYKLLSDPIEYINSKSKLKFLCPENHEFSTIPYNFVINKSLCSTCFRYLNESYSKFIMEYIFNKNFIKCRPSWLINDEGNLLEIDIFNSDLRIGVEYNGIQHYKFSEFFHKKIEDFEKRKKDDEIKKILCQNNGINLIIIPYTIPITKIYDYLIEQLKIKKINFKEPEKKLEIKDTIFCRKVITEKICRVCKINKETTFLALFK